MNDYEWSKDELFTSKSWGIERIKSSELKSMWNSRQLDNRIYGSVGEFIE